MPSFGSAGPAEPAPAFGPDADDERDAPGGRDVYAAASQRRDGAREAAARAGFGRQEPAPTPTPPPNAAASKFVLPPRLGGPKPAGAPPSGAANGARPSGPPNGAPTNNAPNGRPGAPNGRPVEAEGAAGAAPPPEPPPPPKIPSDPAKAWVFALDVLNPFQRTTILENTAFGGFADGTLVLSIRNERYRPILREHLAEVDFVSVLPGFRRFEIKLGDEGRTGREARNEADEKRAALAREAVAASPLVARLVALLGGKVEHVEASLLDGGDRSAGNEEGSDE